MIIYPEYLMNHICQGISEVATSKYVWWSVQPIQCTYVVCMCNTHVQSHRYSVYMLIQPTESLYKLINTHPHLRGFYHHCSHSQQGQLLHLPPLLLYTTVNYYVCTNKGRLYTNSKHELIILAKRGFILYILLLPAYYMYTFYMHINCIYICIRGCIHTVW